MNRKFERTNEPFFWLLFGAGGTISAICFPVLIFIVGILLPFGLIDPVNLYSFVSNGFGKLVTIVLLIFPMWGGLHRIRLGLHDLKIHLPANQYIFYGLATLYSIIVLIAVFSV